MIYFFLALTLNVASAILAEEFCWKEYEDVAIHPVYDENSVALGMTQNPVDDFDECLRLCGNKAQCIGVSWRHEGDDDHVNFNKCFFVKKNGGLMKEVKEFWTALKVRCKPTQCWEERVDWAYNKFNDKSAVETFFSPSSPVDGFQDCLDRCTHSDKCQAVSWREDGDQGNPHYNKCWFMSKPGQGKQVKGMRSARRVSCERDGDRDGDNLVCGAWTKIDADSKSCVATRKPAEWCGKNTKFVSGEGCVAEADGAVAKVTDIMKAGKVKGEKMKVKVKAANVEECIEKCIENQAKGWEFSSKKGRCSCYSKINSIKETSFVGELE